MKITMTYQRWTAADREHGEPSEHGFVLPGLTFYPLRGELDPALPLFTGTVLGDSQIGAFNVPLYEALEEIRAHGHAHDVVAKNNDFQVYCKSFAYHGADVYVSVHFTDLTTLQITMLEALIKERTAS